MASPWAAYGVVLQRVFNGEELPGILANLPPWPPERVATLFIINDDETIKKAVQEAIAATTTEATLQSAEAAPFQFDSGYLRGEEAWLLHAKLQVQDGESWRQTEGEFLVDIGCQSFDAIIPCRKAEELGLKREAGMQAKAFGGTNVLVHRYVGPVTILVPLWLDGKDTDGPPAEVRYAYIQVWGIDEEKRTDVLDKHPLQHKVAMMTFAHDTDQDTSSSVSSAIGEPSTPRRQYEGTGILQFSPLRQSKATAILGLPALQRLRLRLDAQHRRVLAISAPPVVV